MSGNEEKTTDAMKPLTIGKVAGLSGVGVETVRFYEREGLLEAPPRSESGYRQYPPEAVGRIRFTKRAKALGFTLREIRELLRLRMAPDTACADIRRRAAAKVEDIEGRIRDLRRMKGALERLQCACKGAGPTSDCPILEYLKTEEPQ